LPVGRLLVDPYGYVYQKAIEPHARLFTGDLFHWEFIESKNYLSKAKVTLYQLNQESSAWERFISDKVILVLWYLMEFITYQLKRKVLEV